MRVVGIDPAPGSLSTICERGKTRPLQRSELARLVEDLSRSEEDVLPCWDAPLTGPPEPEEISDQDGACTQRAIESFFKTGDFDWKAPDGISVAGYAGCSHWTITRALMGLPRVGRWDSPAKALPFQLIASEEELLRHRVAEARKWIVEVHPAVAAWVWCRKTKPQIEASTYKDSSDNQDLYSARLELRRRIVERVSESGAKDLIPLLPEPSIEPPTGRRKAPILHPTADELDAEIAWLLGEIWVRGGPVRLLGDRRWGSFLLPDDPELFDAFDEFCRRREHHRPKG